MDFSAEQAGELSGALFANKDSINSKLSLMCCTAPLLCIVLTDNRPLHIKNKLESVFILAQTGSLSEHQWGKNLEQEKWNSVVCVSHTSYVNLHNFSDFCIMYFLNVIFISFTFTFHPSYNMEHKVVCIDFPDCLPSKH